MSNSFEYLSELGITVDLLYNVQVFKARLQKLNEKEKIDYNWLIKWMNTN